MILAHPIPRVVRPNKGNANKDIVATQKYPELIHGPCVTRINRRDGWTVVAYYSHIVYEKRESDPKAVALLGSRLTKNKGRLGSIRRFLGKETISFKDFVTYLSATPDETLNIHWRPQHTFITKKTLWGRRLLVDFIGKVEDIDHDWDAIKEKLGIDVSIPHTNKTQHPPVYEMYDQDTWALVAKRYEEDIKIFDYSDVLPGQREPA